MKNSSKRFSTTLLLLIIAIIIAPFSVNAQPGTMGDVVPAITCSFRNADGAAVDGNELLPGEYDVDIILSNLDALAAFQLIANYSEPISQLDVTYLCSDNENYPDLISTGVENVDGRLVFGVINDWYEDREVYCTQIDVKGTVLATLHVVIDSVCDFENVFNLSTDPDDTFVMVDYRDGLSDVYALDTSVEMSYNTYKMDCDLSPVFVSGLDISGQVTVATTLNGASTSLGVGGITVSVNVNGSVVTTTTDELGNYTLPAIEQGEYILSFSGETTIDRNVTLVVSADKAVDGVITVDPVGICICDYTKDGAIDSFDKSVFYSSFNKPDSFNVYCDFTGDKTVDTFDKSVFNVFFNKTVEYDNVTL